MGSLYKAEAADLERLEGIVSGGLQTFVDVGLALAEIRDRKLYALKSGGTYKDFDTYCRETWGWSQAQSYRLIGAASVVETMRTDSSPMGDIPTNERQARELIPVPAEKRGEVMQEATKAAAPKPPTAKDVKKAAAPYVPMAERLERAEKAAERNAKKPKQASGERAEAERGTRGQEAPGADVPVSERVFAEGAPDASAVSPGLGDPDRPAVKEAPTTHSDVVGVTAPSVPELGGVLPELGLPSELPIPAETSTPASVGVGLSDAAVDVWSLVLGLEITVPIATAIEMRAASLEVPDAKIAEVKAFHRFLGTFLLQAELARNELAKKGAAA